MCLSAVLWIGRCTRVHHVVKLVHTVGWQVSLICVSLIDRFFLTIYSVVTWNFTKKKRVLGQFVNIRYNLFSKSQCADIYVVAPPLSVHVETLHQSATTINLTKVYTSYPQHPVLWDLIRHIACRAGWWKHGSV